MKYKNKQTGKYIRNQINTEINLKINKGKMYKKNQ